MKPIYKTLLLAGGTVLLGAANVWAAASVPAIDTPVNMGVSIIQNSMALLMGAAGVAYGGYEIIFNRHFGSGLGAAGSGIVGGALTHNGTAVSSAVGGSAAALIHIPHHVHVVAAIAHSIFA